MRSHRRRTLKNEPRIPAGRWLPPRICLHDDSVQMLQLGSRKPRPRSRQPFFSIAPEAIRVGNAPEPPAGSAAPCSRGDPCNCPELRYHQAGCFRSDPGKTEPTWGLSAAVTPAALSGPDRGRRGEFTRGQVPSRIGLEQPGHRLRHGESTAATRRVGHGASQWCRESRRCESGHQPR